MFRNPRRSRPGIAPEAADATRGGGAGIGCGLHRTDITTHDRGDQSGIDLLPTDKHDVRSLDHRVGGFNHADQSARFDHADCFADVRLGGCHDGQFSRIAGRKRPYRRPALPSAFATLVAIGPPPGGFRSSSVERRSSCRAGDADMSYARRGTSGSSGATDLRDADRNHRNRVEQDGLHARFRAVLAVVGIARLSETAQSAEVVTGEPLVNRALSDA